MAGLPYFTHEFKRRDYVTTDLPGPAVYFSLDFACVAAGLAPNCSRDPRKLAREVREAFSGDIQSFLDAADRVGCDRRAIDEAAERLAVAHVCRVEGFSVSGRQYVCTDLALTIALKSRQVGSIVLRDRPPVLTWDQLFGRVVRLAEPVTFGEPVDWDEWRRGSGE